MVARRIRGEEAHAEEAEFYPTSSVDEEMEEGEGLRGSLMEGQGGGGGEGVSGEQLPTVATTAAVVVVQKNDDEEEEQEVEEEEEVINHYGLVDVMD